jgi:hypothetical protein
MFGGQDFIAGYCGHDEQLSQNVHTQKNIPNACYQVGFCTEDISILAIQVLSMIRCIAYVINNVC